MLDDGEFEGEITRERDLPESAIAASVPGDFVLDVARRRTEDPYYQDNYLQSRLHETELVFYTVKFDWDADTENTFINFEGIDTIADVYLNGHKIGHAENMFIPHQFEAKGLVHGLNEVLVHIYPAALEARKYPIAAFQSAQKYNYESLVIRKAAHMFGWDICPRIVTVAAGERGAEAPPAHRQRLSDGHGHKGRSGLLRNDIRRGHRARASHVLFGAR